MDDSEMNPEGMRYIWLKISIALEGGMILPKGPHGWGKASRVPSQLYTGICLTN